MALIRGVDVSAYQTVSSWSRVRDAGYRYAIVKASEGSSHTSETFADYYRAAREGGLVTGSYHFARPADGDAVEEARYYASRLREVGFTSGRDLPPVLDMEDTGGLGYGTLTDWCLDFVREVDSRLELTTQWARCGVYMNDDFRTNRLNGARVIDGRWLWLAYWPSGQVQPTEHDMPAAVAMWQWTDHGSVPGIAESTDLNVVRESDFANLTSSGESAPVLRHYELTKPIPVPPSSGGEPGVRTLIFDVEREDPAPSAHAPGGAGYRRPSDDGWSCHELSELRVEGMQPGDQYQLQIAVLDKDGEDVLWTSVLTEGRATTGIEHRSVLRTVHSDQEQRVRWRFRYFGTEREVQIIRANWFIEEY